MKPNDVSGSAGFDRFLQAVIEMDFLEPSVKGVASQVLDRGEASLSKSQYAIFQERIIEKYVVRKCTRCGATVSWTEMIEAVSNGGLCSWCAKFIDYEDPRLISLFTPTTAVRKAH